jgi:hypothetical protein
MQMYKVHIENDPGAHYHQEPDVHGLLLTQRPQNTNMSDLQAHLLTVGAIKDITMTVHTVIEKENLIVEKVKVQNKVKVATNQKSLREQGKVLSLTRTRVVGQNLDSLQIPSTERLVISLGNNLLVDIKHKALAHPPPAISTTQLIHHLVCTQAALFKHHALTIAHLSSTTPAYHLHILSHHHQLANLTSHLILHTNHPKHITPQDITTQHYKQALLLV